MIVGRNVHYTFEEVIKETDLLEPGDLTQWMQVICKFYLTERDVVILDALRAKQDGKKQRELSVLFCIAQPHLSENFKRIRRKIVNLYNFLQSADLVEQYFAAKQELTARQFSLLQLAMSGTSFYDIARVEKVSIPDVSITFKLVMSRLTKANKYPVLVEFLHRYKGKFIKN